MIGKYRHTFYIFVAALSIFQIGCAGEPYVQVNNEFNRESDTYLNSIRDRDHVNVCYNKWNANPQQITDLAMAECHRFGKRAAFSKSTYSNCPLRTPIAAIYDCYSPDKSRHGLNQRTGW